jgi:hypothetical protein
MKWNSQNPKNHSNQLTNEMEDLKLSSEMRLKKKKQKWDPSQLYKIKGIKRKASQPHKP